MQNSTDLTNTSLPFVPRSAMALKALCKKIEKPDRPLYTFGKYLTGELLEELRLIATFLFMYYEAGTYATAIYCGSAAAGGLAFFDGYKLWHEKKKQKNYKLGIKELRAALYNQVDIRTKESKEKYSSLIVGILISLLIVRLILCLASSIIKDRSYYSDNVNIKQPWPYILIESIAYIVRAAMRYVNENFIEGITMEHKQAYDNWQGAYLAIENQATRSMRTTTLAGASNRKSITDSKISDPVTAPIPAR